MIRDTATERRTMEAAILVEPGNLAVRRVPIPQPRDGEVLVRVRAATTCGTDLKAYLRGHPQIPMPGVLGHEYSGVVEAVGAGAPFESGQEVMGVHSAPCQQCAWCKADQENLCESIMGTKVLGSYAQYLLIPAHIAKLNVFPKPPQLSFDQAALLEPLACVAHGLEEASLPSDSRVLLIGPGAVGLMFVAAMKRLGFANITLAGRTPAKLQLGEKLGAMPAHLNDLPAIKGAGFDAVIECTGSVEVWASCIDLVRRGGKVVWFGGCPPGSTISLSTSRVHYDQITMLSPFHFGTRAVRAARQWLLDLRLDLTDLLTGPRELSDAAAVFEDLRAGRGIKYVFRP